MRASCEEQPASGLQDGWFSEFERVLAPFSLTVLGSVRMDEGLIRVFLCVSTSLRLFELLVVGRFAGRVGSPSLGEGLGRRLRR